MQYIIEEGGNRLLGLLDCLNSKEKEQKLMEVDECYESANTSTQHINRGIAIRQGGDKHYLENQKENHQTPILEGFRNQL